MDAVISVVFTLEFFVRFSTTWHKRDFLLLPLNMVDLWSFLPFYIELILRATYSGNVKLNCLRVLRLLRMLKILRLVRSMRNYSKIFAETLFLARHSMIMLLNVTMFFTYVVSTIMYSAEYNVKTGENTFSSVFEAMYWCIVTQTTIGFGDITIVTYTGRILACVTAFMGIINLTFIINIIGSCFDEAYTRFLSNEERDFKKRLELEMGTEALRKKPLQKNSRKKTINLDAVDENILFMTEESILPLAKIIAELNFQLSKENFSDAAYPSCSTRLWKLISDSKDLLDVHLAA